MQVCTSLQTDNHASTPPLSFLQAGCPSCRPTNSVKALKGLNEQLKTLTENLSLDFLKWKPSFGQGQRMKGERKQGREGREIDLKGLDLAMFGTDPLQLASYFIIVSGSQSDAYLSLSFDFQLMGLRQ